ncbi:MAG: hypothetical protein AB1898_26520 [Acidobacteriota bacterium]
MKNDKNLLTRRNLLVQASVGAVGASLASQGRAGAIAKSSHPANGPDLFRIRALDRKYDCHRPNGCTLLAIEVAGWPGNEFGLWIPEVIFARLQPEPDPVNKVFWANWTNQPSGVHQDFEQDASGRWIWKHTLEQFVVTTTLTPDPARRCLWYRHSFRNTSSETLYSLDSQTCFHMVNAPQFISLQGSRIWANLDGQWMTTDKVPRDQSPDPRRVSFLRRGLRTERTVVPSKGMPSAHMPEAAHHPLIIAESFSGDASVGIASRDFEKLSNNNDSILRCLHSEPAPIKKLDPGETAHQDAVIIFFNGDHRAIVEHYTSRIAPNWPPN